MAEFGGGGKKARAFFRTARTGAALKGKHRQGKQRFAVAVRGGEFVPLRRFRIITADAEPLRIKFAEQSHGGGIILLRAFGRLVEGGEIHAALVSAIGEVDFAVGVVRRRRWHRRFFLCDRDRGRGEHQQDCTDEYAGAPHAALSGSRSNGTVAASVAAIVVESRHSQSPSAMKSAPAKTSAGISSRLPAKATQGASNTSAHQATRSSMASKLGRSPCSSGSPNITESASFSAASMPSWRVN